MQIFPSLILLNISSFPVLMRLMWHLDHLKLENKGYSQLSDGRRVEEAESQRVLGVWQRSSAQSLILAFRKRKVLTV